MTIQIPPELFAEWLAEGVKRHSEYALIAGFVADKAAEWAADQELEKVCEWLEKGPYGVRIITTASDLTGRLRAAMRPMPPSLKEQALALIGRRIGNDCVLMLNDDHAAIIRRALESIPDTDS